jgi:hypothetical protein
VYASDLKEARLLYQPLILAISVTDKSMNASDDAAIYIETLPWPAPRRLYGLAFRNPTKLTETPETTDRM